MRFPAFALALLMAPAAFAAESGTVPRHLRLEDAERLAVERNLPLIASRQGVAVARAQLLIAGTSPVPTFSYSQTAATLDDHTNPDKRNNLHWGSPIWSLSVGLDYLVERGGKLELRERVASHQLLAAEAQVLDTLRLQIGQLRQSFTNALLARDNLDVTRRNRASLDETERLLAQRVKQGVSAEGDLIRFRANRLQYESDFAAARTAYELSCRDVLNAMGAGVGDINRGDSDAVPSDRREFVLLIEGDLAWEEKPLDMATLREALNNRPDVVAADRQAMAAESNFDLAKAGESRDVSVGPSFSRTRNSSAIGIGFSVPIFTQSLVQRQKALAMWQAEQVKTQTGQVRLQAETDLEKAMRSVELSRDLVETYSRGALQQAEEAYGISRAAYERGAQSLLDVLDAQRTLSQTRVAVNQARASYLTALFQLEQASGVDGLVTLAPLNR